MTPGVEPVPPSRGGRPRDPQIGAAVLEATLAVLDDSGYGRLFDPPRAAVGTMLDRAVARGDICDDIDRDLILDMLGSLVHYHALFGHAPTSDSEVEHAVEALMRGIATDYPALLEHSRRVAGDPQIHTAHT